MHKQQLSVVNVLAICLPLLVYTSILLIPVPADIGIVSGRYFPLFTGSMAVLLLLSYQQAQNGWRAFAICFSLVALLFACPLSALWSSGLSFGTVVGGLLPWDDANEYYHGALRLLTGEKLSFFASIRPLYTGTLATVLKLTGTNLQAALALFTLFNAFSCFLLAREIRRTHGALGAMIVTMIIFLFSIRYNGRAMTENLGLAMGNLGLALLWSSADKRQARMALVGILVMTIGLIARAGAFFVLPALAIWGSRQFWRSSSAQVSFTFLAGSIALIGLGFALNGLVLHVVGSPQHMAFSSFGYNLYGVVVGGKGWLQIRTDHPEVYQLPEPARSQRAYELAFEEAIAHPETVVLGIVRTYHDYINPFHRGAFGFIGGGEQFTALFGPSWIALLTLWIRSALTLFSVWAIIICVVQRDTAVYSLVVVAFVGILLSVPGVPPIDTGMRSYATTIPITAVLAMIGIIHSMRRVPIIAKMAILHTDRQPHDTEDTSSWLIVVSGVSLLLIVFGPLVIKATAPDYHQSAITCPPDHLAVSVSPHLGTFITLVDDTERDTTRVPYVRLRDFRNGMDVLQVTYADFVEQLKQVPSHTMVGSTINRADGQHIWLVLPQDLFDNTTTGDTITVCGHREGLIVFHAPTQSNTSNRMHNAP